MPIVMMHGSGHTTISGASVTPNSRICLSLVVFFCINPVFGIVAVVFSIMSRMVASTDYEGARVKGQIAMFISVAGIIVSVVGVLIFVMIFYTKDT
ncbi:hypothetical protein NP493_44g01016 [Ridgeia piscesae]|uniref:Uncharacterized protein n=1 Tax=Ridgeia piscesae TaxID=27915 RepID=A0AAD9UJN4_RIDPI|nr:hypothetical protein NP493_44g01016 [Ridgeia piscesae]